MNTDRRKFLVGLGAIVAGIQARLPIRPEEIPGPEVDEEFDEDRQTSFKYKRVERPPRVETREVIDVSLAGMIGCELVGRTDLVEITGLGDSWARHAPGAREDLLQIRYQAPYPGLNLAGAIDPEARQVVRFDLSEVGLDFIVSGVVAFCEHTPQPWGGTGTNFMEVAVTEIVHL